MANEVKVPCGGFKLGGGLTLEGDIVTDGVKTLRVLAQQVLGMSGMETVISLLPDSDIQSREDMKSGSRVNAIVYTKEQDVIAPTLEFAPITLTDENGTVHFSRVDPQTINDSNVQVTVNIFDASFRSEEPRFAIESKSVVWSTQA